MWKSKRSNQNPPNPTSASNETSAKSKIKALFNVRNRTSLPILDPPTTSSSRDSDYHPTSPSSLSTNGPGIDASSTTGISANVQPSVQRTSPSDDKSDTSTHSTSAENVYSTILFGDMSQPTSLGTRVVNSMAYQGLKTGVEIIRSFAAPFPPLKAATEGLLQIINVFETVSQNEEDQARMIHRLTGIVDLLHQKSRSAPSASFIGRVERLKQTLDNQIGLTKEHMQRARFRRVIEGKRDSSEIAALQNVLLHAFDVFLIDTTLETESNVEEILMNQLFQRLPRVTTAAYNSASEVPRNGCTAGTREVILRKLVSWATDETHNKIYWLNGMAGTGKTTIAYSFCEKLEEQGLLGASFFCSRSDSDSSDTRRIFPTIAYELSRHLPDASSANLLASIREDHDVGSKRLDLQFSKLIVGPTMVIPSEFQSSFAKIVVLDALDECKNQNEVATILSLLSRHAANIPIKFFITSRPTPEIEDEFRRPTIILSKFLLHDVERDMVEADIRRYVKERFKSIALRKLGQEEDDKWPSEEEITVLVERAGVLFIYAATICSYVGAAYREGVKSRLQGVISSFSGDQSVLKHGTYGVLDNLYRSILDAAYEEKDSEDIEDIRNVLHIVVGSRRPLSVRAIGELLKVDIIRVSTALSPLHAVISVGEESDKGFHPIAPLHASFPDFLGDNKRAGKHCLESSESHTIVARLCLRMIQDVLIRDDICGFRDRYAINELSEARVDVREHITDGLEYACTYWATHVTELGTPDVLMGELMKFYDSRVLRWIECMSLVGKLDVAVKSLRKLEVRSQTNAELHYASLDGRRFLLQNLDILWTYPLETYHSGLVWLPKKSRIRRVFPRVKEWEVVCGLEETWDACESVLKGHTGPVMSVAFSPDGNRVVSGSADGTIRIWNVETSEEERKLKGHSSKVVSVTFSHDGKKVVSGSHDGTIRIWDVKTGEEERNLEGHASKVMAVALSQDGKKLVSASYDTKIRIWSVETGEEERKLEGHSSWVESVTFSHDGKKVASGSQDTTIRIWNVETGEEEGKLEGHFETVLSVEFSYDGKKIVSGSDNTIRIWNVKTGKAERKFESHLFKVVSVKFSYDGKKVVSGSHDTTVRIWNVMTGEEERIFEGHASKVMAVALSQDGKRVVSASYDTTIRVWNVESGEGRLGGHSSYVESLAFSHDGKKAVTGSQDTTIRIWNVETGEEKKLEGHSEMVVSVIFSHDGKKVVSGSDDMTIRIWNVETGKEERKLDHSSVSLALSHDGKKVVSGSHDGTIKIWNVETGEEERKLKGHTKKVLAVALSHNRKKVVSGSSDRTIRIWNVETGEEERKLEGHTGIVMSVDFSHDGKKVASGSVDMTIRIWNVMTGEEERMLEGHSSRVESVTFSHDGKKVASKSFDKTIRIWNVETGEERKLEGHSYRVVSFPDGKAVSGPDDRTIRIWNMRTDEGIDNRHSRVPLTLYNYWIASSHPSVTHNLWLPTRYQNFSRHTAADSAICFGYTTGNVIIIQAI